MTVSKLLNLSFPDLEISDFVNRTPSLNLRTPGQLQSLTSHLSFGSGGDRDSTYNSTASMEPCENLIDELKETCMRHITFIYLNIHIYFYLILFCVLGKTKGLFGEVSDVKSAILDHSQLSGIHPFMSAESINLDDVIVSIYNISIL